MITVKVPYVFPGYAHVLTLPKSEATATTHGACRMEVLLPSLRERKGGREGGRERKREREREREEERERGREREREREREKEGERERERQYKYKYYF